jgi:Domain of unknown function (DUF4262)
VATCEGCVLTGDTRDKVLAAIRSSIESKGFHVTLVSGTGPCPRFAYTVGLWPTLGHELVFAGATWFSAKQVKQVIDQFVLATNDELGATAEVLGLGSFTLRDVDSSWSRRLLLGAQDYYSVESVPALQIVPDRLHTTIDVPVMTATLDGSSEPVWQWLVAEWSHGFSSAAIASTNVAALQGERVTEAARWEESEWEVFAGHGTEVSPGDVRVIPLATLVAADPTMIEVAEMAVGEARWRNTGRWNLWVASGQ